MRVYVVLCETSFGYGLTTNVEKGFLNEQQANRYAEEQNRSCSHSYHWVEEMEVEENA
jgi:hypothetical protein